MFTLAEDETIEDLQLNGLKLIQKKTAFRFGMDSVLLAYFADIRDNQTVADFGTGNGVLPILLSGRNKGNRYYAFEILKESVDLAQRNAVLNHLEDRIRVIHADAKDAGQYTGKCVVDAVVCNPPYGPPSGSLSSPNPDKATARSQKEDTIHHILTGAFDVLKGKGKLFLIYPATQMLEMMTALQKHHLEPKRFRMVYPKASKQANLVLIEAVKDARPTLHPLPPLIIYNEDGSLTNELKYVYYHKEQTEF